MTQFGCPCKLTAEVSARATAAELNRRKIPTPSGGSWAATQVIRVRERLDLTEQPAGAA
jgi:hypothetical protein